MPLLRAFLLLCCLLASLPLRGAVRPDTLSFPPIPEVVVERQRIAYSEEGNPALLLVQQLLQHRQAVLSLGGDYSYRKVERQTLALSNLHGSRKLLQQAFPFFSRYLQRWELTGEEVLPVSVRLSLSDMGYNSAQRSTHEIIRYRSQVGIEQNLDDGTMTQRLEDIFPRVELYSDYIPLLHNRFVSPLSGEGHRFYRYYLTDTVIYRGRLCSAVEYYPHNTREFCFRGRMLFSLDSVPELLHNEMEVPEEINLNFVSRLHIAQDYITVNGISVLKYEQMNMLFSLYYKLLDLYTRHERLYDDYNMINPKPEVVWAERAVQNLSGNAGAERYKPEVEKYPLLWTHEGLQQFLHELQGVPKYKALLQLVEVGSRGYIRTRYSPHLVYGGSMVDIGNIYSFVGRNSVEGRRLRLGGRTTAYLSPYLFIEGYGAYGFRDKRWKHQLSATVSFRPKHYFKEEFPKHDITVMHQSDLFTPGQIYNDNAKDNLLYNAGTAYLTDRSYRDTWRLEYRRDWLSGVSVNLAASLVKDTPAGSRQYIRVRRDSTHVTLPYISDAGVTLTVRYAPGERIYEGTPSRYQKARQQRNMPVLTVMHHTSVPLLGGDFFYNKTELTLEQRLWMPPYGELDYRFTAGKLWNTVPHPMLYTPPANTAYALNLYAFQLLRPLEYVADEYLTLFATYHLKGLLLNRVPLVRRWGLREVVSFNWLYGNMTPLNRASDVEELFVLPTISAEMRREPYAEIGFGIENIARVLRVDYYRRLTRRGKHSERPWGIKVGLSLAF